MKSKNNLTITGVVVSVMQIPDSSTTLFIIAHNAGGHNKPLFLRCVSRRPVDLEKGERITITAYLRAGAHGTEAVIKSLVLSSKR